MNTQKQQLGYLEGWLSSVLNVLLFGLKLWVGLMAGSVAMIADAWHTLSDTLTSAIVLIGFWIAGKPKDKEHPFGHGRADLIGAIVIATLLTLVGFNFLKESYLQLRDKQPANFSQLAVIVFVISVFLKESLAQFSIWAGKKVDSKALIADGWHHRSDAVASLLIVIGALFGKFAWWIDGVLGFLVSLLIIYAAYDIMREASHGLLGETIDQDLEKKIEYIVKTIAPEVSGMHHPHVHRYGDHIEVTLHLRMDENYSLRQAHDIVTKIEGELRNTLSIEPTIHAEPKISVGT
jgi:cation diffusion facilitator family transporter